MNNTSTYSGFSPKQVVLFIDGPLKGQALKISNGVNEYMAAEGPDPVRANVVRYRITQVGFHHGGSKVLLRIGTTDLVDWSANDLADVMLSSEAKEARFE